MQQALHTQQPSERYRRLFEALAEAVYVVEPQSQRLLDVNAATARMHGYSREELQGLPAEALVAPPVEGAPSAPGLRTHRRKDGTTFVVEFSVGEVDWDGRPAQLLLVRDVTSRQLTEAALGESRALLDNAFHKTPLLMSICELPSDRYLEVNDTFCEAAGFSREEMVGKTAVELGMITPAERDALAQRLFAAQGNAIELTIRARNGKPIACRYWGAVVPSAQGLKLIAAAEDVTEVKQLQTRLAQADRLASMGMLAAGVAHEINNPLSYVVANLDALVRELPKLTQLAGRAWAALGVHLSPQQLAELAGDAAALAPGAAEELLSNAAGALEGARRIAKISGGLGTFARVERQELTSVDVNKAIETAATMASNEVKYRATLLKELSPLPLVRATDGKLAQVFLNLIINAAHAIPEGRAEKHRITLRTFAQDNQVFVEVADTGQGISPENLQRVFEPFFTTKPMGVGSGLGLSISKSIIGDFGGEIRVESTEGVGTRVIVRLPASTTTNLTPLPANPPPPAVGRVRGRILVVDDEAPIRRVLLRLLSPHEVVAVGSGTEAVALLEKDQAFDLILCDLMMPEMTGMELHAWLKARAAPLSERVVFISGGAFTPTAAQYLAGITNLRVDKPFNPSGLLQLADELVTAARRAG